MGSVKLGFSCTGMSCMRDQLQRGLVVRRFSYTRVQLHWGTVKRRFTCNTGVRLHLGSDKRWFSKGGSVVGECIKYFMF